MHERMNTPLFFFPEEFDVSTKTGNDFGAFGVKKMRIQRRTLSLFPSSFSSPSSPCFFRRAEKFSK